jgi:hypothetical protein
MGSWLFSSYYITKTPRFATYPFFPLDTIDSAASIGRDLVFHGTLINSIINFGYPSTGLSDAPIFVYHTLSHYYEAGVSILSGVSPIESFGLFYSLKIVLLTAAMLLFLHRATKDHNFVLYLASLALLIPVLTSPRWVIAWSLSLWLPTLVLLATAIYTYTAINSTKKLAPKTLVIIGVIGVVLSLGKLSAGIFYIMVVGLHLFFNFMVDRRIYILGTLWLLFIAAYGSLIAFDRTGGSSETLSLGGRVVSALRMSLLLGPHPEAIAKIYVLLAFLAIAFILYRHTSTRNLVISLLTGVVALNLMKFIQLSNKDIEFFARGLFLTVFVFTVIDFFEYFPKNRIFSDVSLPELWRKPAAIMGILAVVATLSVERTPVKLPNLSTGFFAIEENPPLVEPLTEGPQLTRFRESLAAYMRVNGLGNHNSLLFINSDLWDTLAPKLRGPGAEPIWEDSLLVYAVTGVPLINGVVAWSDSFGFSTYDEKDVAIPQSEFANSNPCRFGKNVIVVTSWLPATFETQCGTGDG